MKRFKKSLVTLLVLVFVLSIMSTGFAASFSDVTDDTTADAVARLTALNIINGYPDGTFKPGNTITRAEFAKVVVNALGLGNAAQYAKGMTKFKDVAATHWASGYIQVASDLGVIKGYPDGTFKPEANVTYAEAITMIMRALGYEPKATALGGYPGGYLAVAAEKGVTDDVNVVSNLGATRGDVAKMINNALDVALMVQKTFGQYPEYAEDESKTLLTTKLGVTEIKGTLTDYDKDEKVITIEDEDSEDEYTLAEGVSVENLLNNYVTAWKLNGKIVFIAADSTTIYDYITDSDATQIEVKFADKTYKFATSPTVKVDGTSVTTITQDRLNEKFGKIVIKDKKVVFADLYTIPSAFAKVVSVDAKNSIIEYYKNDPDSVAKLRLADKDVTVIKDNKPASLSELKAGDVFNYYRDGDTYVIAATSAKVSGTLSGVKYNATDSVYEAKINGTYYDIIPGAYLSKDNGDSFDSISGLASFDDFLGEKVTAYKNYKGEIVYVEGNVEENETTFLGMLLKGWTADENYVKVFKTDGTVATYVYDVNGTLSFGFDANNLYEFTIDEDGVITAIEQLTPSVTLTNAEVEYDKDKEAVVVGDSVYYVGSKSVFIDNTEGTTSDLAIIKWDDIKGLTSTGTNGKVYLDEKGVIKAIVFTGGIDNLTSEDTFIAFVADKVKTGTSKYTLTLEKADEEVDVVFDSSKLNGANINDFVEYKLLSDGKGQVENVLTLVSKTVAEKDGSKFIKFGTSWYKVANDVLVYDNATDDTEYVKATIGDVSVGDTVKVYIDSDNIVRVIVITDFAE